MGWGRQGRWRGASAGLVGVVVASLLTAAPASAADVTTVSMDIGRTGWDQAEPGLSPTSVGSSFAPLFTAQLDAQVYAQPLVSGNVVIAASENDTIYGLDSVTGTTIWQRHVGNAFPASAVPCGDLTPLIG